LPTDEDDQGYIVCAVSSTLCIYVLRSGCAWRLLPRDFPPWRVVYYWFRKWRIEGTFEHLNAEVARAPARTLGEKRPTQRRDIVDSQTAKTTGVGGEQRGYDGGKKVRGILSVISLWTQKVWFSKPRSTEREGP
jgi:transposase